MVKSVSCAGLNDSGPPTSPPPAADRRAHSRRRAVPRCRLIRKVDIRHHPGLGIGDRPSDDRAANRRIERRDTLPTDRDDLLTGPLGSLRQGIGLDQTGVGQVAKSAKSGEPVRKSGRPRLRARPARSRSATSPGWCRSWPEGHADRRRHERPRPAGRPSPAERPRRQTSRRDRGASRERQRAGPVFTRIARNRRRLLSVDRAGKRDEGTASKSESMKAQQGRMTESVMRHAPWQLTSEPVRTVSRDRPNGLGEMKRCRAGSRQLVEPDLVERDRERNLAAEAINAPKLTWPRFPISGRTAPAAAATSTC